MDLSTIPFNKRIRAHRFLTRVLDFTLNEVMFNSKAELCKSKLYSIELTARKEKDNPDDHRLFYCYAGSTYEYCLQRGVIGQKYFKDGIESSFSTFSGPLIKEIFSNTALNGGEMQSVISSTTVTLVKSKDIVIKTKKVWWDFMRIFHKLF